MRTKHYSSKSCVPVIVCINYCLNASLSQWNLGHLITVVSYRFANMWVINVLLSYAVSLIMFENFHAVLAWFHYCFISLFYFLYARLTHGNKRLLTYCVSVRLAKLTAGDVAVLKESVRCSEDSSTAPVFYACGSRLFKTQAIYNVKHYNNRVVSYHTEHPVLADSPDGDDRAVTVSDRICPYFKQRFSGSVPQTHYEQHTCIQSHLDSNAADKDDC